MGGNRPSRLALDGAAPLVPAAVRGDCNFRTRFRREWEPLGSTVVRRTGASRGRNPGRSGNDLLASSYPPCHHRPWARTHGECSGRGAPSHAWRPLSLVRTLRSLSCSTSLSGGEWEAPIHDLGSSPWYEPCCRVWSHTVANDLRLVRWLACLAAVRCCTFRLRLPVNGRRLFSRICTLQWLCQPLFPTSRKKKKRKAHTPPGVSPSGCEPYVGQTNSSMALRMVSRRCLYVTFSSGVLASIIASAAACSLALRLARSF